jgi:glycosyltransferase involved in cell wall biosynthesis
VPKKGFDVLIRAVAELRDRGEPVELVVAGETGSEAGALARLVTDLRLAEVVRFRGTVSQAELLAELRRASVFALACRVDADGDRDGIPNVLVEAMAAGVPVVSTAVSGIPELIEHRVNGLLVAPEDPEALADELARLAKDPDLAGDLAAAGRATVGERFDGERLAHQLARLFAGGRR